MSETIFSKIIRGEVPCHKVYEDEYVLAFLDVNPLSRGHTLVIPKQAVATLDQLPDAQAAAIGQVLPRLCRAVMKVSGSKEYNILQNNGAGAHQAVMHVHFHIIPKLGKDEGLGVGWQTTNLESPEKVAAALRALLEKKSSSRQEEPPLSNPSPALTSKTSHLAPLTTGTTIYTDGACSGNPGPGGWAWAIEGGRFASGAAPATTNQRMELTAAFEAVQKNEGAITIVSDSTYVVNCFKNRWHTGWLKRDWKNSKGQPVANRDIWEPFIALVLQRKNVQFRWVKGHSGHPMNDRVDQLAVEATKRGSGETGE